MSAHQLHRMLGVTYKTAWFMAHRIREAMTHRQSRPAWAAKARSLKPTRPISASKASASAMRQAAPSDKHAVLSLVERGGEVRSFQ